MSLDKQPKLSPYWQRLQAEAEKILNQRLAKLDSEIVDPEACLSHEDRQRMSLKQFDREGTADMLKDVREGGIWGKFIALTEVLGENPRLVFRRD